MPPNYLLNLTGKYIEASADNEVLPTCRSCPWRAVFSVGSGRRSAR